MSVTRIRISKQLELSNVAGSIISTDNSLEPFYLLPGTNGQVLTILAGVPTYANAPGSTARHDLRKLNTGEVERGSDSASVSNGAEFLHNNFSHLSTFSDNWIGTYGPNNPVLCIEDGGAVRMNSISLATTVGVSSFLYDPNDNFLFHGHRATSIPSTQIDAVVIGGSEQTFSISSLILSTGTSNTTTGNRAGVVGNGSLNTASGVDSMFIGSGSSNIVSGISSLIISQGNSNTTPFQENLIITTGDNNITGDNNNLIISTGSNNSISGLGSLLVSNGSTNNGSGTRSVILGTGGSGLASGFQSIIIAGGNNHIASGIRSMTIGTNANSTASGSGSLVFGTGNLNTASGTNGFVISTASTNTAGGISSFVLGTGSNNSVASDTSFIIGTSTTNSASGFGSFIMGTTPLTTSSGDFSYVIGGSTFGTGNNLASGTGSGILSGAKGNTASGNFSTIVGSINSVSAGDNTFITGERNFANSYGQFVCGLNNVNSTGTSNSYIITDQIFNIGNSNSGGKSNAMTVLKSGYTQINTSPGNTGVTYTKVQVTPKAALDVVSTLSGFLPPRMSVAQRDAIWNDVTQTGAAFTYAQLFLAPLSARPLLPSADYNGDGANEAAGIYVPDQEGMVVHVYDDVDNDSRGYQLKWDNVAAKWFWRALTV